MYRYFETKKDIIKKTETRKRELDLEETLREQERKVLKAFLEAEEARNRIFITKIYYNLRFFIREDGSIKNWGRNYSNEYTKMNRNEFIKENLRMVNKELKEP